MMVEKRKDNAARTKYVSWMARLPFRNLRVSIRASTCTTSDVIAVGSWSSTNSYHIRLNPVRASFVLFFVGKVKLEAKQQLELRATEVVIRVRRVE